MTHLIAAACALFFLGLCAWDWLRTRKARKEYREAYKAREENILDPAAHAEHVAKIIAGPDTEEGMEAIINECVDDTIDCCAEACIKLARTYKGSDKALACFECAAILRSLKKRKTILRIADITKS